MEGDYPEGVEMVCPDPRSLHASPSQSRIVGKIHSKRGHSQSLKHSSFRGVYVFHTLNLDVDRDRVE